MAGRTLGAPPVPRDLGMLAAVAAEQRGLLTRRQCLAAGMTDRAIRWRLCRDRWLPVHQAVYQTVPGRDDWHTGALAAQLAVPDSAWSYRTAAYVQGLVREPPHEIELVVEAERRVVDPPGVRVRRRLNVNDTVDQLHWPWRTVVEETLLDVSSTSSAEELFALLGRGFQRRLISEQSVSTALDRRRGHRYSALLTEVLGVAANGAESAMEIRYVRDVEKAHGLPAGVRQRPAPGGGPERHDIAYDEQKVLVELDGRLAHEGFDAQRQDGRRDRRGATRGWLTVRAYWMDVAVTPCELAVDVDAILVSRGARSELRPCRRRTCVLR
jgi:hypothetical protein